MTGWRRDACRSGTVRPFVPRAPGRLGRVLLAEDEPSISNPLANALRRAGFCVIVAADGKRALGLLAVDRFDLVVTDIVMPGTDGLDLLARLRRLQPDVPAFALVGDGPEGGLLYARAALCMGADATLPKPVDTASVLALAHRLVERGRSDGSAATTAPAA